MYSSGGFTDRTMAITSILFITVGLPFLWSPHIGRTQRKTDSGGADILNVNCDRFICQVAVYSRSCMGPIWDEHFSCEKSQSTQGPTAEPVKWHVWNIDCNGGTRTTVAVSFFVEVHAHKLGFGVCWSLMPLCG